MPHKGDRLRDAIVRYIESWQEEIEILTEKPVGYRFVKTPRTVDIILKHKEKYLGIEAKIQEEGGTAYQKLSYALDDCITCPIPTIIVFSGAEIKDDMKSKLILSGIGVEVKFRPSAKKPSNDKIEDTKKLLRQRVCIELGLDWFKLFS